MDGDVRPDAAGRSGLDLVGAGSARGKGSFQRARAIHCWCLSGLLVLFASLPAEAACVSPSSLTHSTIRIARYFDDAERDRDLLGIRGTGWFLSPTSIATVGHVASAMHLSEQDWKDIEIVDGEITQSMPVRILRSASTRSESIAVLEVRGEFSGARSLPTRMEPLLPDEAVVSLAYPSRHLRTASGRFVRYGDSEKLAGMAMFELYDGDDRLVLDHGSSGAPVFDCEGRVVAAVSNLITQTLRFPSQEIRVSTAWGSPNVVSVPVQILKDFSQAQ
jgi:Trypsin-like peptidase domain